LLGSDWVKLARTLEIDDQDINLIISEYPDNVGQQAMVMLRLWLNTEGNKATGNALEKALKKCDREDIVDKCMFNVKMVTDNDEAQKAQEELLTNDDIKAFKEENNVANKSLMRDYSIDVNIDENDYTENSFAANDRERLDEIREEVEGVKGLRDFLKQEEETSVYEREEHKYVAEEKEFASSSYKQEYQQEVQSYDTNVITEMSENRSEYLHEEMKKMSVEESNTINYSDGDRLVTKQTESKKEEQFEDKEMFSSEKMEVKQMHVTKNEAGNAMIITESKTESKEQYEAESQETKLYQEAEVITAGGDSFQTKESKFESEKTHHEGFQEHHTETVEQTNESNNLKGTSSPVHPQSSSYSDSDPESPPRSPSPKVSPGSKSPSPRASSHDLERPSSTNGESDDTSSHASSKHENGADDISPLMKETEQELLDEMIIKDVPESESSTDPVKKFEETLPSSNIESIKEEESDTE